MPLQIGKGRVKKSKAYHKKIKISKTYFSNCNASSGKEWYYSIIKKGTSNCYNNCHMSVTIHSILGNIIAKYIATFYNVGSPVLKAFDKCKKKVACQTVKLFKRWKVV